VKSPRSALRNALRNALWAALVRAVKKNVRRFFFHTKQDLLHVQEETEEF
jgi:hypothetical protein